MHALASLFLVVTGTSAAIDWNALRPGLDSAVVRLPRTSAYSDLMLHVARVDPRICQVRLFSSQQLKMDPMPAPEWSKREGLHVVTNAGMFHPDGTPVGYMKNGPFIGNTVMGRDRAVLAFDPGATILDRTCDDFSTERERYGALLQGIRMVDCARRPTWQSDAKQWSAALLAWDRQGRLLFLHVRSPYGMRELTRMLLALPLRIARMMYLEGGPEASLVVDGRERVGSYETGFNENDDNVRAWPLPNVIGAVCPST